MTRSKTEVLALLRLGLGLGKCAFAKRGGNDFAQLCDDRVLFQDLLLIIFELLALEPGGGALLLQPTLEFVLRVHAGKKKYGSRALFPATVTLTLLGIFVIKTIGMPVEYVVYESERQLPPIIHLIENELSEPYSIYTYRYFIHQWPHLCFMAMDGDDCIGVIICKIEPRKDRMRGYIAMLAVAREYRKQAIGSTLVQRAIEAMKEEKADEIVLETENTNVGALGLYQRLGFIKDKRLHRYYLNGVDAFRLKLFCKTMVDTTTVREHKLHH